MEGPDFLRQSVKQRVYKESSDKFLLELMEGMKNFMGEYTEEDYDTDIKEQERVMDITGSLGVWGIT